MLCIAYSNYIKKRKNVFKLTRNESEFTHRRCKRLTLVAATISTAYHILSHLFIHIFIYLWMCVYSLVCTYVHFALAKYALNKSSVILSSHSCWQYLHTISCSTIDAKLPNDKTYIFMHDTVFFMYIVIYR